MEAAGFAACGASILTMVLSRTRCIFTNERCGCGFTDNSLFPASDTELKIARINGVEVAYVYHGGIENLEDLAMTD
jgi:hypothetical protein